MEIDKLKRNLKKVQGATKAFENYQKAMKNALPSSSALTALGQLQRYAQAFQGPVSDFLEQQEQMRNAIAGPATAFLEQQEQMRKALYGPLSAFLEQQEQMRKALCGPLSALTEQADLIRKSVLGPLLALKEHRKAVRKQALDLQSGLLNLNKAASEPLMQVCDFLRLNSQTRSLRAGRISATDSFPLDFAGKFEKALAENDTEIVEDTFGIIERIIDEKLEQKDPSVIEGIGLLNFFYPFLLFLMSLAIANASEKNMLDALSKVENNIQEKIQILISKIEPRMMHTELESYYVVLRHVNLRAKPETKSPVIAVLPPNQRVKLFKRKYRWLYVEYFDYIEGVPKTGWVFKKYLKLLK